MLAQSLDSSGSASCKHQMGPTRRRLPIRIIADFVNRDRLTNSIASQGMLEGLPPSQRINVAGVKCR